MIDIIYKTVNPPHLKNLQILQNIKNRNFEVANPSLLPPLCCWGKQIFKIMLPGGMSNFLLPRE